MAKEVSMPVGIVVERCAVDNPWIDHRWRPVAVLPGLSEVTEWRELRREDRCTHYLCASLPVTLHRKETEAYCDNLASERPSVYVVLDPADEEDEGPWEVRASLATVSPYDAQDQLDSGESIVEAVPMPDELLGWVEDFVAEHHENQPFKKRKRKHYVEETPQFGKRLHAIERRYYKERKPQ